MANPTDARVSEHGLDIGCNFSKFQPSPVHCEGLEAIYFAAFDLNVNAGIFVLRYPKLPRQQLSMTW